MNAPRDLGPDFRSWLDDVPPMPPELPQRTLDEARHTRQRRRWRWFLPGPKPTAGVEDERNGQDQPTPMNPRNGGTRSMFSATNLFGIAASIALAGAIALAVPFTSQQQDGATPGAEAPRLAEITSFTGQLEVLGKDQIGTREEFDWGFGRSGEQWTVRLTTTDPRYSGLSTGIHNHHQLESGGAFLQVHTSRQFTEEPDGTWLSTSHGYQDPDTTAITSVTQSTGEGLYEGLSAYVICEQEQGSMEMACHGIIFDGQWPELPSDTPDEIPATYLQP